MKKQLVLALVITTIMVLLIQIFPAYSAVALWEDQGNWSIHGDTTAEACIASASYDTGRTLSILFMDDTANLVISGLNVIEGNSYETIIAASTGESGVLEAIAADDETVVFLGLNNTTVRALANAQAVLIQGLGPFELTGSKQAMASAWECYQTLNSF